MPSQREQLIDFADYNAWANARLYDAVAALPDAALRAQRRAAFFGSILGVLNHLLVADRIWMDRVENRPPAGYSLDTVLHEELAALQDARTAEDARIQDFVGALAEGDLDRSVTYKTSSGAPQSESLGPILSHVFNHHTHHRGQAHALLSDAGASPPPLDYIFYRRALQARSA